MSEKDSKDKGKLSGILKSAKDKGLDLDSGLKKASGTFDKMKGLMGTKKPAASEDNAEASEDSAPQATETDKPEQKAPGKLSGMLKSATDKGLKGVDLDSGMKKASGMFDKLKGLTKPPTDEDEDEADNEEELSTDEEIETEATEASEFTDPATDNDTSSTEIEAEAELTPEPEAESEPTIETSDEDPTDTQPSTDSTATEKATDKLTGLLKSATGKDVNLDAGMKKASGAFDKMKGMMTKPKDSSTIETQTSTETTATTHMDNRAIETATKMLRKGYPVEDIVEFTHLDLAVIEAIKRGLDA